jgi:hypothetical protein
MDAFNAEMGAASQRFNRLADAQEFLLTAVAFAESYARGEGGLPRVHVPDDAQMMPPAPPVEQQAPVQHEDGPMPRYLRNDPPALVAERPGQRVTDFAWGE